VKFRVTMKNPDSLFVSAQEAAVESVRPLGLGEHEAEYLADKRREEYEKFAGKWMKWGEYLTVEFDTEAGTATVVPCL
jgi:hypothetical protein